MPRKFTFDDFVKKARLIHGDKYSYSPEGFKNLKSIITIYCKECKKEYRQKASKHLLGHGCLNCRYARTAKNNPNLKSTDEFIAEANLIHGNRYDYSKVKYINAKTKVEIICPVHGAFWQEPRHHLQGHGCPICNQSIGEQKVANLLEENKLEYFREKDFGFKLRYDFWIPELNLCIEYNGIQHYQPVDYFGGKEQFEKQIRFDKEKYDYCLKNGIELIIIDCRSEKECLENLHLMISSKKPD